MPSENGRVRTTVDELARRLQPEMLPINTQFGYFPVFPIAEEDLKQYLHDPVSALPPAICELLPRVGIVLAPYLERGTGKTSTAVVYQKPAEPRLVLATRVVSGDYATLFFTIQDEQVADYHYFFFDEIAGIVIERLPAKIQDTYHRLLREE